MTQETETGFGTGLRAELSRKRGESEEPTAEIAELLDAEVSEAGVVELPIVHAAEADEVPDAPVAADEPDTSELRAELDAAAEREERLRAELQQKVEAHGREHAAHRELAVREVELEQHTARIEAARTEVEEREVVLRIQLDQLETERTELASQRTGIVAEEARLTELAKHIDSRSLELESADQQRAQAAAHVSQQLAAIAERERELKRERVALEARRNEEDTRIGAREESVRKHDASALRRGEAAAERELAAQTAFSEVARERELLQEREHNIATREATLDKRNEARERMLANGEAAMAAWEKRLRALDDRLDREQAGHGQASQEAFALLAELERREERVSERETRLMDTEAALGARGAELAQTDEALRLKEARLGVDLDMREDDLVERERAIAAREQLLENRERDLGAYVGELQGRVNDRNVA